MESCYGKFSLWVSWSKPIYIYRHQFVPLHQCSILCVLSQVGARTLTSLWPRSFTLLWREDTEWVDLTTLLTTCMTHRSPSHVLHILHMSGWSPASVAVYQSCSDTFTQQLFFNNVTFVSLNPLIWLLNQNFTRLVQKITTHNSFDFSYQWKSWDMVEKKNKSWFELQVLSKPCPLSFHILKIWIKTMIFY